MSIKTRIAQLEKAPRETANQEGRCRGCGSPRPPFDDERYETLSYDDQIAYLVDYFCEPCRTCGRESEASREIDRIYGDRPYEVGTP